MGINETLPQEIRDLYEVHEWRHACAILSKDFPDELGEVIEMLLGFRLKKSMITKAGGSKSEISSYLDSYLYEKGWIEKKFDTAIRLDNTELETPTHKIDCFKNRVALEIEWKTYKNNSRKQKLEMEEA